MKAEDLAMIIDEIDEDMIEDAWTESGMKIFISERSPLSFWKIAVTTAACFAAVLTGVFCFTKINHQGITPPNDSSLSASESSEIDINSESPDTTNENSHRNILDTLPKEGEENRILFDDSHTTETFYAEKFTDNEYARIIIEETNASEERPVYLVIYNADALLEDEDAWVTFRSNCISDQLKITGPGEYTLEYDAGIKLGDGYDGGYKGAGKINCLDVQCSPADYDGLILKGYWIP